MMPLYNYICDTCNTVFEEFNSMSDMETAPCPTCNNIAHYTVCAPYIVRAGTLFDRRKIPTEFKEGVLDRIKANYPTAKQYDRN